MSNEGSQESCEIDKIWAELGPYWYIALGPRHMILLRPGREHSLQIDVPWRGFPRPACDESRNFSRLLKPSEERKLRLLSWAPSVQMNVVRRENPCQPLWLESEPRPFRVFLDQLNGNPPTSQSFGNCAGYV